MLFEPRGAPAQLGSQHTTLTFQIWRKSCQMTSDLQMWPPGSHSGVRAEPRYSRHQTLKINANGWFLKAEYVTNAFIGEGVWMCSTVMEVHSHGDNEGNRWVLDATAIPDLETLRPPAVLLSGLRNGSWADASDGLTCAALLSCHVPKDSGHPHQFMTFSPGHRRRWGSRRRTL